MFPRLRGPLSAALIALACLLAPAGALAAWATYEIADPVRYEEVTAPLAADPDVRDALADAMTVEIMREIQVRPSLRDPVEAFTHDAARSFTQTEAFRAAWHTANREAHDAVLRALRAPGSDVADRPVLLDLAPVGERVKRRLAQDRVPFAHRIPVAHNKVTVLSAADLDRFRKGYRVLDVAGLWLPLGALALAVTGVLVAARRRRALCATGLGTALGGLLLGLAVALGRRLTLSDLPPDVSPAAAGAVYDALTGTLRRVTWGLVGLGAVVAGSAWLTGRYARRRRAPATPTPAPPEERSRVRA
ncbi:hypothetical protein [Streptomyces graminofaciens]|uniref:hypothetical protein n=1 Tax=Streptomyces graminofaciens TaxID=68212 RepID=UPI002573843A|nr:hypothetical protein [Streptomyces graminofaciens]